uniref:PiggyBac transposable element-derived protein 4 C-terminal zinc-ribbon domain-containing protein n=1 Tax=Cuerna arida TaxID=1464854 RepID=A0A1B6GZ50_9HEMI
MRLLCLGNCLETGARRLFLRNLSNELVAEHIQRRAESTVKGGIYSDLQQSLKKFKANPVEEEPMETAPNRLNKRKRCEMCKNEAKCRLTKYYCYQCKNPVCLEHTETVCKECAPKMTVPVQQDDDSSDE